ncbi:MAG TPA: DUF2851 domain-containing protein [Bacteroidales bacterium]|nr:MAG: hypothetical protein A2W98_10455 [Bacteroidetes bacterium GWF2_33_38]OFY73553.1 MAG: hypothetical protein A2265_00640 [Bacteroidetes bacterium RIFOXYA12_FULL_33_9]OFY87085.1 MAG: hypothetical protein A2236_02850 [Bacteroidetes bacterium RIFOXYA2_FULL_33_7]HBF87893.1 DUF2851 domain-containing protein [Bacteroidales bacterium]
MTEDFLQFIWKNKLFSLENTVAETGEKIQIISVGEQNLDSGPDFFNAKIKIDDTIWAGNVEVHVNSSDWNLHKHSQDKAYGNVVLHVVYNYDKEILQFNNEKLTTFKLKFDDIFYEKYDEFKNDKSSIHCRDDFKKVDSFILENWITRLVVERLERKTADINLLLEKSKNNWEEIFYQVIGRSFGFKINSFPFEQLTSSIPINILAKHKNNLFQIEALLFGQAGFLDEEILDEYYFKLKKEYLFLKSKYKLTPIQKHLWRFMRTRPANFPTIRIAQFAKLIFQSSKILSKIIETNTTDELKTFFDVDTSDYWKTHFNFGKESYAKDKAIGESSVNSIIINTIVPFMFIYGKHKDDESIQQRALSILTEILPEKNAIITEWKQSGAKVKNAFYSQAYIQLSNEYCRFNKCLNCQIGNSIIRNV